MTCITPFYSCVIRSSLQCKGKNWEMTSGLPDTCLAALSLALKGQHADRCVWGMGLVVRARASAPLIWT